MLDSFSVAGLTGIVLIDVAIGVIFALLTFSLIASALQEAIAGVLNFRGEHLRRGITRLVKDEALLEELLERPGIVALKGPSNQLQRAFQATFISTKRWSEGERFPSAIPKGTFARALVEALIRRKQQIEADGKRAAKSAEAITDDVRAMVDGLAVDDRLKARLTGAMERVDFDALYENIVEAVDDRIDSSEDAARAAAGDAVAEAEALRAKLRQAVAEVEAEVARWFDTAMDRVTGWYVRRAKTMLFALGVAMAAATGFDIIGYGQQLVRDDALRSAVVARAQAAVTTGEVGAFALDAGQVNLLALEARNTPEAERTADQKAALAAVDRYAGEDGELTDEEAARADQDLRTAFALVGTRTQQAIEAVNGLGAELDGAWSVTGFWNWVRVVIGWLLIGIGCTLGGQFWFDLLKGLLKVRAGASGDDSDKKPEAATG